MIETFIGQFNDVTVFTKQDIVFRYTHQNTEFGVSDEVHQSFTPGRSMEIADWVADTLGATVAVLAYTRWTAYRQRLESPVRIGKRRTGVVA